MKFCEKCQNMLTYLCSKCGNKEKSDSFIVSESSKNITNEFKHNPLRKYDVALPRSMMKCVECDTIKEVVITKNRGNLKNIYQCIDCNNMWGF